MTGQQISLVLFWIWTSDKKLKNDTEKNLSIYLKTNGVGTTILKLCFWISLSELIQGK